MCNANTTTLMFILGALPALGAKPPTHGHAHDAPFGPTEAMLKRVTQPVDPQSALEGMSEDPFLDDLTPGYVIIDGDIQVPLEQYEALRTGNRQAAGVFGTVNYWGDTVPYAFASNVTPDQQQLARDAMNEISARAGITFRVRTVNDPDWIRFQASTSNNSPVGRQGGPQIINIVSWNNQIIIVHEIYHSLGFWHEQSAPDRDTYVTINTNNICGASTIPGNPCNANVCQGCSDSNGNFVSCAHNFDIRADADVWGPYDFDSFMHYGRGAFSCNGNDTITVNQPWNAQWQSAIGQRNHFSLLDELTCRGIYPFNGDRWLVLPVGTSGDGTFFDPFKGTFTDAYAATPANGTLLIDPGIYLGVGTFSEPKTIRATYGTVTIGAE